MKILYDFAMSLIGTPYIYGGQSPLGFDCSGGIFILLNSVGMAPKEDLNADGLYRFFLEHGDVASTPSFGSLLFFGSKTCIKHVAFALDDRRMWEAAGGNEWINSIEKANAVGACCTINLISRRKDLISCIKPRYALCAWT